MAQSLAYLYSERARLVQEIASLQQQLAYAQQNASASIVAGIQTRLDSASELLAEVNAQIQASESQQVLGTASAGQVIAEEAQSRAEGATVSNPVSPPSVLAPDGRINRNNLETGTDAPVRTQESTQSTPPAFNESAVPYPLAGGAGDEDSAQIPFVTTQPGVGANRDDNTRPNTNTTSQTINTAFNRRIVPRKNVLDQYASYSYTISWYLLTPEQYNQMVRSQKKNCASWQLLVQSGGAPTQAAGVTANSTVIGGRNQFFDLDYYLDNLEIESRVPLKGTGSADGRLSIRFTIMEPNGITLIENLYKAVSTLYKQNNITNIANYPLAQYCLVIRFYGYDENGQLITTGQRGTNGNVNPTDPKAIIEKFYPFVIEDIKFKVPKDRVVEYTIQGKPIPHFYNKSQDRGTITFNFELTGETVEQILRGKALSPTIAPPNDGRRDSPTPNTSAPSQPSGVSDITGEPDQEVGGGTINSLGVGA